jgi:hypothetical protein
MTAVKQRFGRRYSVGIFSKKEDGAFDRQFKDISSSWSG